MINNQSESNTVRATHRRRHAVASGKASGNSRSVERTDRLKIFDNVCSRQPSSYNLGFDLVAFKILLVSTKMQLTVDPAVFSQFCSRFMQWPSGIEIALGWFVA